MTRHEEPSGALVGVLMAAAIGLCCGLPILAASGFLAALAGLGVGSWTLIAAGAGLVAVGVVRSWRRRAACAAPPEHEVQRDAGA